MMAFAFRPEVLSSFDDGLPGKPKMPARNHNSTFGRSDIMLELLIAECFQSSVWSETTLFIKSQNDFFELLYRLYICDKLNFIIRKSIETRIYADKADTF